MKMTTISSDRYQQDEMLSAILSAGSVLLFGHVNPDGDTLGSILALKLRLERMGKRAQAMVDGTVPGYLSFLPGADGLLSARNEPDAFDLALAVDVASPDMLGRCEALFSAAQKTAVIDHHVTNTGYAQINLIDGGAPASAIPVYRLLGQMELPISQDEAICLYTALSTDTGNFVYNSTNAESFAMMSGLMEAGLPLAQYSRLLFRQKELPHVRLLAQALPSLRVTGGGRIAGLCLSMEQMRLAGANGGHAEGVVNYAIDLEGVGMAYFAREIEPGRVKVSLRALEPYAVDVIAARHGGGGHRLAAGVTLALPLDESVRLIERDLEAAL